jgi:hypothetical protein
LFARLPLAIRVESHGGGFRADEGALAGRQKAAVLEQSDRKALPALGRARPTDEEIARPRRRRGRPAQAQDAAA